MFEHAVTECRSRSGSDVQSQKLCREGYFVRWPMITVQGGLTREQTIPFGTIINIVAC
jgi:hypothetical protein